MSCVELHELLPKKLVVKSDKFQFYMHPLTVSLLFSVGGVGSVGSWVVWVDKFWHSLKKWLRWCRSIKFGMGHKKWCGSKI